MSSKEEVAQRLLDQCEAIESSRRKIDEAVQNSIPKENENISAIAYRQQIEQCRRALVTSQENAKLKHEKMENTITQLKKEIENMRADLKCLKDCDKINNSDTSTLQRDLRAAKEWAMKAQKHANQVNQDNAKLKQIIAGMKRGDSMKFWNRKSSSIFNKQQQQTNNTNIENGNTPTRNVFKNLGSQIAASFRKVDEVQIATANANSSPAKTATLREKLDFSSEGTGTEKKASRVLQDLGSKIGSKFKPQEDQDSNTSKTMNQNQPVPQSTKPVDPPVSIVDEKDSKISESEKEVQGKATVQDSTSKKDLQKNEVTPVETSSVNNMDSETTTSQNEAEKSAESLPASNNEELLDDKTGTENQYEVDTEKSKPSLEKSVNDSKSVVEEDEVLEDSNLISEESFEKVAVDPAETTLNSIDSGNDAERNESTKVEPGANNEQIPC